MKDAQQYSQVSRKGLVLCWSAFMLTTVGGLAQDAAAQPVPQTKGIVVRAEVIKGDTVPVINLQPVYIVADYPYKNRKQYEEWTRLKYNVKKVYPYAIIAAARLKEYERILEKMPHDKSRKAYMKVAEKALKEEFEPQLKQLTVSQGRILIKLIDRETGHNSYELVKELRGNFSAFMWQGLARLFGENLKEEYDPKGEDAGIERAIGLIESGRF